MNNHMCKLETLFLYKCYKHNFKFAINVFHKCNHTYKNHKCYNRNYSSFSFPRVF
jgi:hypothetical protein